MSEDNINNDSRSRTVIASAIDNDCLILEEPDTGYRISWPLDKIPQPFRLGNPLNLILQSASDDSEWADTKAAMDKAVTDDDVSKRKLLEELIN